MGKIRDKNERLQEKLKDFVNNHMPKNCKAKEKWINFRHKQLTKIDTKV